MSHADVAELVDALDLGSSVARRVGSSPSIRTSLRSYELRLAGQPGRVGQQSRSLERRLPAIASGKDRKSLDEE